MCKIFVCGPFGGKGYYYDRIFSAFDEAEAFIEGIGGKYVEWSNELTGDLCIGWYDEFWGIMYYIDDYDFSWD